MKIIKTDKSFGVFSLEADRDYILARLINFSGSGFAPRAGYSGQQACEKYFKSLMVQEEAQYLKTHDLIELSKYCEKWDPIFGEEKFLAKIKIFDDFREVGRYGGEATHDPNSESRDDFQTAGFYSWTNDNINLLDEIVFIIRGKLNFKKIEWSDSILCIINNDNSDLLMGTWKLPIELRVTLITDNNFFK